MPHRHKHVPPKRVTQPPEPVTRQGRISKTKAKDTIKSVTTTPHRPRVMASPRSHSVSSSSNGTATSQPEFSRLGALEKGFEMMLEIHQANKVTLDQLVERLDGIGGVSLTPPVPPVTEVGCKNTDCPRRHVCVICGRDGHHAFQCPLSTPSTSK